MPSLMAETTFFSFAKLFPPTIMLNSYSPLLAGTTFFPYYSWANYFPLNISYIPSHEKHTTTWKAVFADILLSSPNIISFNLLFLIFPVLYTFLKTVHVQYANFTNNSFCSIFNLNSLFQQKLQFNKLLFPFPKIYRPTALVKYIPVTTSVV
jgi:hypothetical protein